MANKVKKYQKGGEITANLYNIIKNQGAAIKQKDFENMTLDQQKEFARPYLEQYTRTGAEQLANMLNQGYEVVEEFERPVQTSYITEEEKVNLTSPIKRKLSTGKRTGTKGRTPSAPKKEATKTYTRTTVPLSGEIPQYQQGGLVNTTGYKKGSDTEGNPYNIIPSNLITMEGVYQPIWAYPNNDKPVLMKPGKEYNFKNSSYVIETPEMKKNSKKSTQGKDKISNFDNEEYYNQIMQLGGIAGMGNVMEMVQAEMAKKAAMSGGQPQNTYPTGFADGLAGITKQFGQNGVDVSGITGTDPGANYSSLLMALAMSPLGQQKPNNVDLTDPVYQMQDGGFSWKPAGTPPQTNPFGSLFGLPGLGTLPPVTAPQIPLMQKKSGFWNSIGKGLGFVARDGEVNRHNQVIQGKNTELMGIAQQKADAQPNPNMDMLTQLPQIMSLFSSLANLEKGGELRASSGINLDPNIPLQAEVRDGMPEMIQTENGVSQVKATKSHEDMPKDLITDIAKEGDYVYSAHKSTKEDWSKIPLYVDKGGEYEEGVKGDLPSLVTVGGLLSMKNAVPAKVAEMVTKKFPYKELKEGDTDYNDPFLNRAYEENASARETILGRVRQTAEERKERGSKNGKNPTQMQLGGKVRAAGAVTEAVGNVANIFTTRKTAAEQKKFLQGQLGKFNNAYDNNKAALGSSASLDQLNALSMDTDVNRKQVDRSFLDRYNPETSNTIQNNALQSSFADMVSSLRNNPNMDKVTKTNALANMTSAYYDKTNQNAANYTTDTRNLESVRQSLNQSELDNFYNEIEAERGLNNQQRAMVGSIGSDNIRNQANVDFQKLETQDQIQQAILQAEAVRRGAIGQGIANVGASITKAGSLFGGGGKPNAAQQMPYNSKDQLPSSYSQGLRDFRIPNRGINPASMLESVPQLNRDLRSFNGPSQFLDPYNLPSLANIPSENNRIDMSQLQDLFSRLRIR